MEADSILAWVATLDAPSVAALQRVQQGVRSIVANTNQSRADYGLIPEELRTDTNFNSYVPLRGKVDMLEGEMDLPAQPAVRRLVYVVEKIVVQVVLTMPQIYLQL